MEYLNISISIFLNESKNFENQGWVYPYEAKNFFLSQSSSEVEYKTDAIHYHAQLQNGLDLGWYHLTPKRYELCINLFIHLITLDKITHFK